MVKRHFPQQQQLRLQAADLELPPDVQRLQPSLPSPKRFSPFRGPTMFATVCVKRLLHHGLSLQHVPCFSAAILLLDLLNTKYHFKNFMNNF